MDLKAKEDDESPLVCLSLQVFPFVRYKILVRFYQYYTLFCLPIFVIIFFFVGKDDILFPNVVERNFQSFNLSFGVQYYSQSFHGTRTSTSAKSFRPQDSPYFLRKPRTREQSSERTVWNKTNGRSLLSGDSEGGRVSQTEERSEKYVLIKTIETDKEKLKEKKKAKITVSQSLVVPNSFLHLINNKEPKGIDAQVEYIP